jgi:hypothetical protein
MRNQRRVADKCDQFIRDLVKARFVPEELGRKAVDGYGLGRHITFGIDVAMKILTAGEPIDQLDAPDLDQPMPLEGIKPGRLGIEHYLAHACAPLVAFAGGRITAASAL